MQTKNPVSTCLLTPQEPNIGGYPGPANELNLLGGIQSSFPWMAPQDPSPLNKPIQTITKEGNIVSGYSPSILRPFDDVYVPRKTPDGHDCSWPCYAGSKYQKWCSKENAIGYYGMRPLVDPKDYNGWLINMFNYLVDPGHEASKLLTTDLTPMVYCDNEKTIMDWLMGRIQEAVLAIPQLQNNGSWKFEQFYPTDTQLYAFKGRTEGRDVFVYKIIFNLYNTLRSTATLVECVILDSGESYRIAKFGFVSLGDWEVTNDNLPMGGYNLGRPGMEPNINLNSARIPVGDVNDWIYGNTLVNQKFNEYGFYEPGLNCTVEAGVPDSLLTQLKMCENSMLSTCEVTKYSGQTTNGIVNPGNMPVMVKNNPNYIYTNNGTKINSLYNA